MPKWDMWIICHKHLDTTEYIKNYSIRNLQTLRANNSRIIKNNNAKFSGYCLYMKTKI